MLEASCAIVVDAPRTLDRCIQLFGLDGLEQVGQCLGLERAKRVLIEAGDEDHQRERNRACNRAQHFESIQPRHLNVEKDQVRSQPLSQLQRPQSIFRLANDFDPRAARQQPAQAYARGLLVINQQAAQSRRHADAAVSFNGRNTVARLPCRGQLSNDRRARAP